MLGYSRRCRRCQVRGVGGVRSVCVSGPERCAGQGSATGSTCSDMRRLATLHILCYASKSGNDARKKSLGQQLQHMTRN